MDENAKGLYDKYVVTKKDGVTEPTAIYFVLRLDTDTSAQLAARHYADWVRQTNPRLSDELTNLLNLIQEAKSTGATGPLVLSSDFFGEEE